MCPHCNSPTPQGAASAPYCCLGCQAAYALVRGAGLARFYELRGAERLAAVGARQDGQIRAPRLWLPPLRTQAESRPGEVIRLVLDVQGLQCLACVWLLERLFTRQSGAVALTINTGVGSMELCYRRDSPAVEQFLDDAEALGYRAGPPRKQSDAPLSDLMLRLGLCAALAMNTMIFSFSQYFGLAESEGRLFQLFAAGSLILASLCVLLGGTVFFRSAIGALRRGVLHMDVPIALGIALSYLGSVWSFFFTGGRAAYFDTLCAFITLMLLGRLLQQRLASHHRRILLSDDGVDGLLIRTIDAEGRLRLMPATAIQPQQVLLCAPGELVPVRAELLDESARFSLSWISGESQPAQFHKGQEVPAGAHNQSQQAVRVRADEPFSASALCQLLAAPKTLPAGGEAEPARYRDFWHVLSRTYVLVVLILAALGFLLWLPAGPLRAVEVTVAILVVTCPCALGVATPLAYELVQARLRRRGLFVRHASFLDRALRVRKVLFDKTGTLTLGELTLTAPEQLNRLPAAERAVLYQLVARSNHPISQALLRALTAGFGPKLPALDPALAISEESGQGLTLRCAGREYRLGRRAFALPAGEAESAPEATVSFSCNGELLAQYSFGEALCPDARAEVAELQRAGFAVWMLSGDAPHKVADSARRLGVPDHRALGGLGPEDKAQRVRELDGGARDTLMIGDGINDAPAFGAAACAGTPAVDRPTLPERADFYFLGVGLGPIALALALARQTRTVIRRNLGLALLYNAFVLGLSFAGLMTPLRCALAMPLSSLVILLLTVHSLRERAPAKDAEPAVGSAMQLPETRLAEARI